MNAKLAEKISPRTIIILATSLLGLLLASLAFLQTQQVKTEEFAVNFLESTGASVTRNGESELGWREMHGDDVDILEEWKFQGAKHLTADVDSVSLDGATFQPEQIKTLIELPNLTGLYCYNCPITDEMAVEIGKLRKLQKLDIAGSRITTEGLHALSGLQLRSLKISGTSVTDLSPLRGMTSLESLYLDALDIGGHLEALASLKNLRVLSASESTITDSDLTQLAGLTKLELLHLNSTRITNAGIAHLTDLDKVDNLQLDRTKVDDGVFEHLAKMTGLRLIIASNTGVSRMAEEAFVEDYPTKVGFAHKPAYEPPIITSEE